MADTPTPTEQVSRLYEQSETAAAKASERLVGSRGFAGLLGQMAENTAALTKLSADAADIFIRNLRLAGRRDIVRLARQLQRTEDKLERVLQEVEALQDLVRAQAHADPGNGVPSQDDAARAGKPSTRPRRADGPEPQ
jgi:hypothetical protein